MNITFMNAAINAERIKKFSLVKYLFIVDHSLGYEFLAQIKPHYGLCYKRPQMNQEKLQHFMISKVDAMHKVEWLKLWNSTHVFRTLLEE